MQAKTITVDQVPFGRFHLKMFGWCAGGPFLTGYVLGDVAIGLSVMSGQIEISDTMSGLIGSSALFGAIFGSLIGGYMADKIGRKTMYLIDFAWLAVMSLAQVLVGSAAVAFALRFALGIGIGATFAIAGPLLAEFSPQRNRGVLVSTQNAMWYVGYASGNVVCYLLLGLGADAWRWMLASSAVPALIWLVACLGMPESPCWLAGKGRGEEAGRVLSLLGPDVALPEAPKADGPEHTASYADIFRGGYGKWVLFISIFWSCTIIPVFSLGTYTPEIVAQLGFGDGTMQYLGTALINLLYLIGLIPTFTMIDTVGRRPTLILSFAVSAAALLAMGLTTGMELPFAVVLTLFVLYGAAATSGGAHQYLYPNELFPTSVRATAVGLVTSISRVVSAVATFATPIVMGALGVRATILISAGALVAGLVATVAMAPETKGMDLSDAAALSNGRSDAAPEDAEAVRAGL